MTGNVLLAIGLVLTTASQLRLPAVPLGPGEVFILLWLGYASFRLVALDSIANPGALFTIGAFWFCFALALSIGTCIVVLRQQLDASSMSHDTFAYLLVLVMSCLIVATMRPATDIRRTAWLVVGIWDVALIIQIAIGWNVIDFPEVQPWYWDRFRGWSENPNQIALFCAILTPLSLHLALSHKGIAPRIFGLLSCIFSFVGGRLTKSDAFLLSTLAATIFFLALRIRTWLTSDEYRTGFRFGAAVLIVVAAIPLAASLSPYALATADEAEGFALSLAKDGGGEGTKQTAAVRASLWEAALKTGLSSASLGLGPGPHLEKPNTLHSEFLPTPFEAHSTLLDVFTQGGLLGVLAVCCLFAGVLIVLLRAKLDALGAGMAALLLFSFGHFVLRHPIVWFVLAASLVVGSATAKAPSFRNGG